MISDKNNNSTQRNKKQHICAYIYIDKDKDIDIDICVVIYEPHNHTPKTSNEYIHKKGTGIQTKH